MMLDQISKCIVSQYIKLMVWLYKIRISKNISCN